MCSQIMKNNIKLYSLVFLGLFSVNLFAQQQLENPGFESWENVGSPTEEPLEWSSIKTSDNSSLNSSAPKVCEQSSDAHSGSYSVKLTNVAAFFIVANGILTNGRVHSDLNPENGYVFTDASNSQWNTPFTSRPDSLVGWYKFAPQNGDKGKVEAIIHTGNAQNPENGTASNFVARARFILPSTNVTSWSRFSVPFHYFNSNPSSHILMVLSSGDSTQAKAGSIAYFDDLELIYNPLSVDEIDAQKIVVYSNLENLCIQLPRFNSNSKRVSAKIYDLQGRVINSVENLTQGINYTSLPKNEGIYLVSIDINGKKITKKVVITN
jgi:hypothetical protein